MHLTFTWAFLLDADPGDAVPVEDVLNIIQRTIVLMGNVNALTTQAQQQTVLEAGGKEVAALMKDEMPQAGRHLFSDQFAATLTEKVKASIALRDAVRLTKPATTVSTGSRSPFRVRGFGSQRGRTPFASQLNPADIETTIGESPTSLPDRPGFSEGSASRSSIIGVPEPSPSSGFQPVRATMHCIRKLEKNY